MKKKYRKKKWERRRKEVEKELKERKEKNKEGRKACMVADGRLFTYLGASPHVRFWISRQTSWKNRLRDRSPGHRRHRTVIACRWVLHLDASSRTTSDFTPARAAAANTGGDTFRQRLCPLRTLFTLSATTASIWPDLQQQAWKPNHPESGSSASWDFPIYTCRCVQARCTRGNFSTAAAMLSCSVSDVTVHHLTEFSLVRNTWRSERFSRNYYSSHVTLTSMWRHVDVHGTWKTPDIVLSFLYRGYVT